MRIHTTTRSTTRTGPARPALWRMLGASAAILAALAASAGVAGAAAHPATATPSAHTAVVGGQPASEAMFPWLAIVQRDVVGRTPGVLCTGVVIAPDAVLTAAHCLVNPTTHVGYPPSDFEVATGAVDASDTRALKISRVAALAVYPSANYYGDAAVLILATPTASPAVTLASASDAAAYLQAGTPAFTAGWGETHAGEPGGSQGRLYWGVLSVQPRTYCQGQARPDELPGFDAAEELCAVDPRYHTTDCFGDSGGPLIVEPSRGAPVDIGIDSAGGPGCRPTEASYFTRVDFVSAWVAGVLAEVGR